MTRKDEGKMTGGSPTQTGAVTGRFMKRLKQSVASGETDPSVLDKKRAQAKRIRTRTADRQSKLYKKQFSEPSFQDKQNAEVVFNKSFDRFGKAYRQQQDSTELVRGARLALAEAILRKLKA